MVEPRLVQIAGNGRKRGDPNIDATAVHGRSARALHTSAEALAGGANPDAAREDWPPAAVTRRSFVKLLGAGAVAAGAAACEKPAQTIVPWVRQPADLTPGVPMHYATAVVLGGHAIGVLAESHAGRPTRIEGNPDHPASLGATGTFEQATIQQLYDPDRARSILQGDRATSWEAFTRAFDPSAPASMAGETHILIEATDSPLIEFLVERVRSTLPSVRFHIWDPTGWSAIEPFAAGRGARSLLDLAGADVVVALGDDLFGDGAFRLRYARDFAEGRRLVDASGGMNRLHVVETMPTVTGASADHRLRASPTRIDVVAAALRARIAGEPYAVGLTDAERRWVDGAAADLMAPGARGVVSAGVRRSAATRACAADINDAIGATGVTVRYLPAAGASLGATTGLRALAAALADDEVKTLVVLGGNPAYAAPGDLGFAESIGRAGRSVYVGLYRDETARRCDWFVPESHALESWGDARAADGTVTLIQPLIAPLYATRTRVEVLGALAGSAGNAHELLRESWRARAGGGSDAQWESWLRLGTVPADALPAIDGRIPDDVVPAEPVAVTATRAASDGTIEVSFEPDAKALDGRFANSGWMQELPHPISKLTWDNAAYVGTATAARLGVVTGDVIELRRDERRLQAPVYVLPGHADDCVTLPLGYGRAGDETNARGVGFDANALRTADSPWRLSGVAVRKVLGGHHDFATTQSHWQLEGRPLAPTASLDAYRADPEFTADLRGEQPSLYAPARVDPAEPQWAMAIDLTVCTGCSACVVACQAENNSPVVGKREVMRGREMHWLRIDRYWTGDANDPDTLFQPMLCQHCENAPCEYVCPVNATVHSPDGLNEMVYNRCVGTRFCSNNCPYKVRRFNWIDYNAGLAETEKMPLNPGVTVRERGVMEKCTFCVQRIRRARIDARVEGRTLADGDVRTACQQACPTRAIRFGSIADPDSDVSRWRAVDRGYDVLHELGTRPRVRYLAKITNPAPAAGTAR